MEQEACTTLEQIQQAAVQEFLDKGFLGSSCGRSSKRRSDHRCLYGYFSSKEALFASIVEPHAAAIMGRFMQAQQDFAELPEAEQPQHVGVESTKCTEWMVDYIYQHMDACKLLICCAEGTSYETFVHNMVEVEVESTFRFLEVLRRLGHPIPVLDRQLCHIIASGMFNGILKSSSMTCPMRMPNNMSLS